MDDCSHIDILMIKLSHKPYYYDNSTSYIQQDKDKDQILRQERWRPDGGVQLQTTTATATTAVTAIYTKH